MNALKSSSFRLLVAAMAWTACGLASSANAERIRWDGRDANGSTTSYVRDRKAGVWTEQTKWLGGGATYRFSEHTVFDSYILLYDPSRKCWVALHNDRMDIWNESTGRWDTLWSGGWVEVPRTASRYSVEFVEMKIHDDKEGGDGKWHMVASIGGYRDVVLVNEKGGGTGDTIRSTSGPMLVVGPSFSLAATVSEYDGGLDAKWEHVGRKERTINRSGVHRLDFNSDEGKVSVFFRVTPIE
jgi:hypothetical protein